MFKRFLNKIGSTDLYTESPVNGLNYFSSLGTFDFRSNYLLNLKFQEFEDSAAGDHILLIGSNPRFEASTFNVRLRRLVSKKSAAANAGSTPFKVGVDIATIGSNGSLNMTYKTTQLGNGTKSLFEIACGKSDSISNFFNDNSGFLLSRAKNPVVVLGATTLERTDANSLKPLVQYVLDLSTRVYAALRFEAPQKSERNLERKSFT